MNKVYDEFFRKLLDNTDNLSTYVDSLYAGSDYSNDDLNYLFGVLKSEGLLVCQYADNRAWVHSITFEGKHYFETKSKTNQHLVELIDKMNEIESFFHHMGGNGISDVDVIFDVQNFQDWLQEINFELREIHGRTNDHFIWETLNVVNRKMNGFNDRRIFSEIQGKLKVIRRNIDKYYPNNDEEPNLIMNERVKKMNKTPRIFISHSSKDVEYVAQIVNLLDGMGLDHTQVFCSSLPGYGIPIDTNIFDYLRKMFYEHELHVIFVHSDNYYKSSVSLNEMGAAWVLKNEVTSILIPGFGFEKMTGVVNGDSISIKLDMADLELKDKLNQLYSKIILEFNITKKADVIWEQKRDTFINEVRSLSVKPEEKSELTEDAIRLLKAAAEDKYGQIFKSFNLEDGDIIQAGEMVMNNGGGQRESARWIAALEELVKAAFICQIDEKGKVFRITNNGYMYLGK